MTGTQQGAARRILVAAGESDIDTLRQILDQDPSLLNAVGDNPYWGGRVQPLHLAVIWEQDGAVEFLLAAGADPTGENDGYGGWSPLMLAARGGSPRIVERLRSAGARVGLFEAAALGDLETVRSVIGAEPASACAATVDQTTPLHLAGSVEVAEALLAAGADLAAADAYGRRPLDAAIGAAARRPDGSRAIADHLIESGAAVDASTFAALGDLARLGPVLKSDPASIHRIGGSGSPPLHAAVAHGRLDTVRWLLENGADANAGDSVGVYPLHLTSSAHHHSVEIARELLAAGADPAAKDGAEEATPASWAEFQRLPELEKLLRTTLD